MSPKILIASSIGPGKEYTGAFLLPTLQALSYSSGEEPCDTFVALDGVDESVLQGDRPQNLAVHQMPPWEGEEGRFRCARIAAVREASRQIALQGGYDYLFFLDSDTIPPADAIEKLLAQGVPIATGLYNLRELDTPALPMPSQDWLIKLSQVPTFVPTFGMGCMLIKREVLEGVDFPYNLERCEDELFCESATEAGFGSVLLDATVACWHARSLEVATRLVVGEAHPGAVLTEPTAYRVHTRAAGEFLRGVPRSNLTAAQLAMLGVGFETGNYAELTLERKTVAELLKDLPAL